MPKFDLNFAEDDVVSIQLKKAMREWRTFVMKKLPTQNPLYAVTRIAILCFVHFVKKFEVNEELR